MAKPGYRDKDKMEELLFEEGMNQSEVADMFGVTEPTISNWVKRHGIDNSKVDSRRGKGPKSYGPDALWKDEEALRELVEERGLSTYEISKKLDCTQANIKHWVGKHGIDSKNAGGRSELSKSDTPATYFTCRAYGSGQSYEMWQDSSPGVNRSVRVHRLLAVAEYGFDAVCGMDVHHKSGVGWDNRPENIELLTRSEHARLHSSGGVNAD